MSPSTLLRLGAARLTPRLRPTSVALPTRLTYQARLGSSDYGSPSPGDPDAKDTPNPSADKEHPGPPPPKAGEGTGSTGTKGTSEGHNIPSAAQQQQKRGYHSSRALRRPGDSAEAQTGEKAGGPEPKILDHKAPERDAEQSEEVKRHNEEFEKRSDRAANVIDDEGQTVSQEFWKEDKNSRRKE